MYQTDQTDRLLLSTNMDPADGVSVRWQVPVSFSAERKWGEADCGDRLIKSQPSGFFAGSKEAPPSGVCAVGLSNVGALNIYQQLDRGSINEAVLTPGAYASVVEKTTDGWLRVETDSARRMSRENDMQVDGSIDGQEDFFEFGLCDQVPLVSDSGTFKPSK